MHTLGINAAFHDSAACLVCDGRVIAAAEEERFTRIKHAKRPIPFSAYELPFGAIHFCLKKAGLHLGELDHVVYAFDPYLLLGEQAGAPVLTLPLEPSAQAAPADCCSPWDPLFLASIVNAPRHLRSGAPHHLQDLFIGGPPPRYRWHFLQHHLAHAASAWCASPFQRSAVMTIDGRGEVATTAYWLASDGGLELLGQVNVPHSLGLLYEKITAHLGFLHSSDEYKVMAMASFGRPRFLDFFRSAVALRGEGRFELHLPDLTASLGPPRRRGAPIEQVHFDIAHSLQRVLEETVLELAAWLRAETGCENLCMAGGVALNCVLNGVLRERSGFKHLWVQPAAHDAGTALGAALWIDAQAGRSGRRRYQMEHVYLGPAFDAEEIEGVLRHAKLRYRRPDNVIEAAAELLAQGKIIAWFQGAAEFGPRALGARSILASPCSMEMQARLNDLKGREEFRPVAPVVPEERAAEWFENAEASPFMLFVFHARPECVRRIPAALHHDGTARVQTVNRQQNPLLHRLLTAFQRRTGIPLLVNTSFNTRNHPIVCSPHEALEVFFSSALDALVIGPFLIDKAPVQAAAVEVRKPGRDAESGIIPLLSC